MRTNLKMIIVALMGLLFVSMAFAQDAAATAAATAAAPSAMAGITSANIVTWLTPVLVPLVLAGLKLVAPKLPTWVIPIAAPVLGMLIDFVNSLATSHASNLLVAAALGLAGVGLREVKENLSPAGNGGWPTVPPSS